MRQRQTITGSTMLLVLGLTGCSSNEPEPNRPSVDHTPVGCGYKWFQTGYSPYLVMDCAADRSALRAAQTELAVTHAWEVAKARCPGACPPRELTDTVDTPPNAPDGVCRGGRIYFTARVFLQCGPGT